MKRGHYESVLNATVCADHDPPHTLAHLLNPCLADLALTALDVYMYQIPARLMHKKAVDAEYRQLLTPRRIADIVALVPDTWLVDDNDPSAESAMVQREVYVRFLQDRLAHSALFVQEAQHARDALI